LTELIENFLLRILIGITMISMTEKKMRDLRKLIIKGMSGSVPWSQNIAKSFDVHQGKNEGPVDFLHRLKDQMRRYSGLSIDDPLGQGMLKLHFITNSWPDIGKKLQKIENWKYKSLDDLLRKVQKVYVRRDEEKQKQKAKMLSILGQTTEEKSFSKSWT
jgi:hypothetical protein